MEDSSTYVIVGVVVFLKMLIWAFCCYARNAARNTNCAQCQAPAAMRGPRDHRVMEVVMVTRTPTGVNSTQQITSPNVHDVAGLVDNEYPIDHQYPNPPQLEPIAPVELPSYTDATKNNSCHTTSPPSYEEALNRQYHPSAMDPFY